jgi:toxin FitB
MYLLDTNVVSEARKGARANEGVRRFLAGVRRERSAVFMSVITVGELRRGVELIRRRGDEAQAGRLERWLDSTLAAYADAILPIDAEVAQLWGHLRAPRPEHALDKFIAATAVLHDLTVVSRNARDFAGTGARCIDPFD